MFEKDYLREEYSKRKIALSQKQKSEFEKDIHSQVFDLLNDTINSNETVIIHTYLSSEEKKEIDTFEIITFIEHHFKNSKICVPKITHKNEMHSVLYSSNEPLIKTNFKLSEPLNNELVKPQDINIAIVPMLVGDRQGYRIGYGKGYYDKYLKLCKDSLLTIGLSYFTPVEKIEISQWDMPLKKIIYPRFS